MAKKKIKERQRRFIEKGMDLISSNDKTKRKSERRIRKPKMPASLKSMPHSRQK